LSNKNEGLLLKVIGWQLPPYFRAIESWFECLDSSALTGKKVLEIGANRNSCLAIYFSSLGANSLLDGFSLNVSLLEKEEAN